MADKATDREIWNPLEAGLVDDLNQQAGQDAATLRELARAMFAHRISPVSLPADDRGAISTGFIGDGLKVRPQSPASGNVVVTAGWGFRDTTGLSTALGGAQSAIGGVPGLNDLSVYAPLFLGADEVIAVPEAPSAGFARKDIIEVRVDRRPENAQTRDILDPLSGISAPGLVSKTLAFDLSGRAGLYGTGSGIVYKPGVVHAYTNADDFLAAGVIAEPATDTGYIKIATINVKPAATTFDADVIVDWRPLVFPGGQAAGALAYSVATSGGATVQTFKACALPPGVGACAVAGASLVQASTVYVLAGDGSKIRVLASFNTDLAYGGPGGAFFFAPAVQSDLNASATEVTTALQTALSTATPPVVAAVGQLVRIILTGVGILDPVAIHAGSPPYQGSNLCAVTLVHNLVLLLSRIANP